MATSVFSQKNMMCADGWGDDDDTQENWDYDSYDDGLGMDDLSTTEPTITDDIQHAEDVHAAEQEIDDAIRNGDADAADDAMAQLAGLLPVVTKPKRKSGWKPPPQTSRIVPLSTDGEFKPAAKTWIKPRKSRWAPKTSKTFPTIQEADAAAGNNSNGDLLRLASIRKGVQPIRAPVKLARMAKPVAWKVGATPFKQEKFNKAKALEKSGANVSERQMKARERNHARSEGFAKAQSGEGARFTRICTSVLNGTPCRHGDRCRFAHKPEQLVARACNWGCHCRKKSTCNFPHTPEELAAATTKLQAQFAARLGLPAPAPVTVCQPC